MFGLLHGKEHFRERLDCMADLERVYESRPAFFAVEFATDAFGDMNFHYIAHIKEGVRKSTRMGADGVKKPGFGRIALNSVDGKGARWEYRTTFPTRRPDGLRLARIIPKREEMVPNDSWVNVLDSSKIKENGQKEGSVPSTELPMAKKLHHAGKPHRLEEREWSKFHRPEGMSAGEYL